MISRLLRSLLDTVLFLAVLALAVFAALSYFGRYDWRIDLLSHGRWHYLLIACILLPILLIRRWIRFAGLLGGFIIWNARILLYPAAPLATMLGRSMDQTGRHLRLANFNVYCRNESSDSTVNWLREVQPDLVVLTEFTSPFRDGMQSLQAGLPHYSGSPDPEGNGIEIYMDTPWYVPQPHGVPIDLMRPNEEILAEAERHCRATAGFRPLDAWKAEVQDRLEHAA